MISQMVRARKLEDNPENKPQTVEGELASPVKTVLETLTSKQNKQAKSKRRQKEVDIAVKKPTSIEDVPFRRQDRRILNARNRRIMDRRLIVFIFFLGLILVALGVGSVVVAEMVDDPNVRPLIIVGPVLMGGGLVAWMCTVEVCVRLYRLTKRMKDPELDHLVNPHEVKHWMDPNIIPFGWGLYSEEGKPPYIDKVAENSLVGGSLEEISESRTQSEIALQMEENLDDFPHRYVTGDGRDI